MLYGCMVIGDRLIRIIFCYLIIHHPCPDTGLVSFQSPPFVLNFNISALEFFVLNLFYYSLIIIGDKSSVSTVNIKARLQLENFIFPSE